MNDTRSPRLKPGFFFTGMTTEIIIDTIRQELYDVKNLLRPWFKEDDAFLSYQPLDKGWSGLQILEHVMLTNHFLLLLIDKASAKAQQRAQTTPIAVDWVNYKLLPKELESVGVHKSFAWIRPEHMEPVGNMSLNQIMERVSKQFLRCEEHLNILRNGEGTLYLTTMTVNNIGKLDVYQYIYFLALHARRHIRQLEENKIEFLST